MYRFFIINNLDVYKVDSILSATKVEQFYLFQFYL